MNAYKVTISIQQCLLWAILADHVRRQDFSDGVKYMKQLKRTETGAEGNLNVIPLAFPVFVIACDRNALSDGGPFRHSS